MSALRVDESLQAMNTTSTSKENIAPSDSTPEETPRESSNSSRSGFSTLALLCPICSRLNGRWLVAFEPLWKSKTTISRRKRCKRCHVSILYKAQYGENGIAVVSFLDLKAKKDLARAFNCDLKDVFEAEKEVLEARESRENA